ncbi:hypothetical protein [Deinococcus hopiensis]|uniref:Uncharacterized protein n=1 Tax=Deinococcus hopiensis KR-140 TaxID=695939 RepID=A0A1W1UKR1_9DEIO|nr:hypothetical protein [Deinococcus hopiensis]SMB81662.1 hypothetical protein SAMN00790413_04667 [Deinococcus hopiensis KR-140]
MAGRLFLQGGISASVNDKPVADAMAILEGATHTRVLLDVIHPIGKPASHKLHIGRGKLGYRALAADVLGVTVTSLAALDTDQAATVRSCAYGQMGLTTGQRVIGVQNRCHHLSSRRPAILSAFASASAWGKPSARIPLRPLLHLNRHSPPGSSTLQRCQTSAPSRSPRGLHCG